MATTIKIKNSSVAGMVPNPTDLIPAELAINLADHKLFSKDETGTVFEFKLPVTGEVPGGGTGDRPSGPSVGELYYDTDVDGLLYWNGSSWEEVSTGEGLVKLNDGGTQQAITGGGGLSVEGKVTSSSTEAGDSGTTLATKDYVDAQSGGGGTSYWDRDAASETLYPLNSGDDVAIGGILPSVPNVRLSAADGSGSFASKVTSASTVAGDADQTLTTKDYVDAAVAGSGNANNGAIQFNAGNGLSEVGDNATANQANNTLKTFSVDAADNTISVTSAGVSVNTANLGIPDVYWQRSGTTIFPINSGDKAASAATEESDPDNTLATKGYVDANSGGGGTPGNGAINFNAGVGLDETGSNATANQSGSTTKTLFVKAANSTIDVSSSGIAVDVSALNIPASARNGGINFNAGFGLSESGSNASADQAISTTKTFSVKAANSTISVSSSGISVNTSALPAPDGTNLGNSTTSSSVTVTSSTGNNTTISSATSSRAGVMTTSQVNTLSDAADDASQALSNATTAQSTANGAQADADAAQSTANSAVSAASAAQSTANAALPKSGGTMTGNIQMASGKRMVCEDIEYGDGSRIAWSYSSGNGGFPIFKNSAGDKNVVTVIGDDNLKLEWASPTLYGNVNNVTAIPIGTASDYRIKENVTPLPDQAEIVKQLNPVNYTIKEATVKDFTVEASSTVQTGFIAHEIDALISGAAVGEKDDPDQLQSINLYPIVTTLTKALQEALIRIEALEAAAAG